MLKYEDRSDGSNKLVRPFLDFDRRFGLEPWGTAEYNGACLVY